MSRLYIGNLPFDVQESKVKTLFHPYDASAHVTLIIDRETGRGRGFGFVEIDDRHCDEAISNLNGVAIDGRRIRVEAAKTPGVKYTHDNPNTRDRPLIKHRRKGAKGVHGTDQRGAHRNNKTKLTLAISDS